MTYLFKKVPKVEEPFEGDYFTNLLKTPLTKRMEDCKKILKKYPDRIPVIVDRGTRETPKIDKNKFLVPKSITISEFMIVLRARLPLQKDQAIYFHIQNNMPRSTDEMSRIYLQNKSEDGYLYMTYSVEASFG